MAEDLIDNYVDRNGVRGDTDFIVAALREVYNEFKKLESVKIDMKGVSGLAGLAPIMQQAKAGADSLATATNTVSQRIAQMNGNSKEFTQVLLTQTKAQKEAAQTALLQAKAANESAKAKQAETKATEQSAKAKEREAKLLDQAVDDYFQLSKAYNEASLKAKNYVLRLGEGHPIAIQAVKDANDLGNTLKRLDASVGQNQRNVGNYASAYNGLGMSFAQVSRELPSLSISFQQFALAISNNLPMVADELSKAKKEIASLKAEGKDAPSLFSRISSSLFSWQVGLSVGITLLTLYSKQIVEMFSNLFSSSRAINQLKREQELLNNVQKEVAKSTGQEVAQLDVLYKVATNVNIPIKERKKAVNEIQDQYPDYFKNIKDEIILQGQAAAAYDKTKAAILETAKTRAIENELAKLATNELELLQEKEELINKKRQNELDKRKANASTSDPELRGLEQFNAISEGTRLVSSLDNTNKKLEQIAKDREFLLNQITNAGTGFSNKKTDVDKLKDNVDEVNKLLADARRTAFEIRKTQIEDEIKAAQEIISNEKLSQKERIEGLGLYYDANKRLSQLNTTFELNELTIQTENQIQAARKKGEEDKLTKKQIEDEVTAITEASNKKRELLLIQSYSRYLDLERDYREKRLSIISFFDKRQAEAEKKLADEIEKTINDRFNRDIERINALVKKNKDAAKENLKTAQDEANERLRLQLQLSTEIQNLAFTLLTSTIEREKNELQDQIDLLEEKKQKDIEVANQTITNAQDRAAAISVIEARANAEREQLQKRQRDLDIKKAQFDKAQAIARIIQETATNVIKYFGTPLALLAGAIGAIQLATVIAQPIPRYKHGKNINDLYEGPAVVGDGGKKEAIIRENGQVEITSDRPQLTYVKSRDIVIPDATKLANYVISGHLGGRLVSTQSVPHENNLEKEVKAMGRDIVHAIKSKPELNLSSNEAGLSAMWKYGANQIRYIQEQTNW